MNTDNQPDHSDWVRDDHVTQSEPARRHCGIWDGTVGKPGFSVRWDANLGRVFPGAAVFTKEKGEPAERWSRRERSRVERQADSWCHRLKCCFKPYPPDRSCKPLNVLFWLTLDWVGCLSLVLRIAVLLENCEKSGYSTDERETLSECFSPVCLPNNRQWFGI